MSAPRALVLLLATSPPGLPRRSGAVRPLSSGLGGLGVPLQKRLQLPAQQADRQRGAQPAPRREAEVGPDLPVHEDDGEVQQWPRARNRVARSLHNPTLFWGNKDP